MSENIEVIQIREKIAQIKDSAKNWFTNFYLSNEKLVTDLQRKRISWTSSDESVVIIHQRKSLKSIYFFTSNLNNLVEILKKISTDISEPITINFPMNVRDDSQLKQVAEKISEVGFNHYAIQKRLVKLNPHGDNKLQKIDEKFFPKEEDLEEIEKILYENLDYLAEIFPDTDELREMIRVRNLIIYRDESSKKIASIIGFHIKPSITEWVFWITRKEFRHTSHGLKALFAYQKYVSNFRRKILYAREQKKLESYRDTLNYQIDDFQNHVFLKMVQDINEIKQTMVNVGIDRPTELIKNLYIRDNILEAWIKRKQVLLFTNSKSLLLLHIRKNFWRLYFQAINIDSLFEQLTTLIKNFRNVISVDLINVSPEVVECFNRAGFVRYGSLTRMFYINQNIKKSTFENSWFAEIRDVDEIENILYENIDSICEQIPDREDIAEAVENHQIIVARTKENIIAALLFFERNGATVILKFWACKKIFHGQGYGKLVYDRYMKKNSDARRFLLWVRDNNSKAKKIYERYGLQYDNMRDVVFLFGGDL